ncbi:MAG: DUF4465 domain-containing protein [Bacteroidales bacterium]|nr:DUF4465 domain-containing protein [Bacteroidales bacterium]
MKNSFKIVMVVAAVALVTSCMETKRATSTFSLGTTFEMTDYEIEKNVVDSIMFSPMFSWENVTYFHAMASGHNLGYQGGFVFSTKKGKVDDSEDMRVFSSADPGAGALCSLCYLAYNKTPNMPKYDIEYDFSGYYSAISSILGFYVCNSLYTKMLNDNGEINPGDYLKLKVNFYKADNLVGSVEKYLVDYYTSNILKMVNEWEAWDIGKELSESNKSIGSFDAIKFEVETSGGNLRPCFCLDNFIIQLSVEY